MSIENQPINMTQIDLIQKNVPTEINNAEQQFVAFNLGDEEYAVDILMVQEIIRWTHITRVPKAPGFIKGVLNLRGTVVPVLDSHLRFKLPQLAVTEDTRIIVFKVEETTIGMTIDQVTEVLKIPEKDIERPTDTSGMDNQFIKGIGKVNGRLLIILDVLKIINFGVLDQRE